MTKNALTSPTWLYHAKEAPAGRLFEASDDRPIDHPGKGWEDHPQAPLGTPGQPEADTASLETALAAAELRAADAEEARDAAIARAEKAEAALAAFDKDGDGAPGGSKPKA